MRADKQNRKRSPPERLDPENFEVRIRRDYDLRLGGDDPPFRFPSIAFRHGTGTTPQPAASRNGQRKDLGIDWFKD
jgi:hypothetical protein